MWQLSATSSVKTTCQCNSFLVSGCDSCEWHDTCIDNKCQCYIVCTQEFLPVCVQSPSGENITLPNYCTFSNYQCKIKGQAYYLCDGECRGKVLFAQLLIFLSAVHLLISIHTFICVFVYCFVQFSVLSPLIHAFFTFLYLSWKCCFSVSPIHK